MVSVGREHPAAPVVLVTEARAMRLRDRVRAVRDLLRHHLLEQGQGQPDVERLPSEYELSVEYSTSRNVIRHALAALQQEGLIQRTQGLGTTLRRKKVRVRQWQLQGLALGLNQHGDRISYEPHLIEYRAAPVPVAEALGLEVGARVVVIERKSFYCDTPVTLNSRYLPAHIATRLLADTEMPTIDWFGALEQAAQVPLAGALTITEAALADEWLAPDLGLAVGSAVILMHRTIYDTDGRPVEFDLSRSRGDLLEIESWTSR